MTKRKSNFKSTARRMLFAVLTVIAPTLAAEAQTVTISPQTGNVIAAVSTGNENHLAGYGGAWVHNQLPLNVFTSDDSDLTDVGLPKTHANNIAPKGNKFVWYGGMSEDGYFTISLPKGYRFTGYKMVITNNVSKTDFTEKFGSSAYSMTERVGSFSGTAIATVNLGTHNTNSAKEYTLQRTATLANDMGNILYFRLGHTSNEYAAVYIQSLEISFECDKNFIETVSASTAITDGVDCVEVPFSTDRIDMGPIEWKGGTDTGSSNKAWRYTYENVKDLSAKLMLYNDDGVKDGTASTVNKKDGNIKSADDDLHFALQNDVYYIETPTEAITQNNKSIPVGYRITGARLHYAMSIIEDLALGKSFYITNGNGQYMNTSLKFTDEKVLWSSTSAGRIYSGSTYLRVTSSGTIWKTYSLSTTTSQYSATNFVLDGRNLYYSAGRSNYYITTSGTISNNGTKATLATESEVSPTESSFTLKLYGTDGNTVAQEVAVNSENPQGELEVVLLNNDALKFEVCDLEGKAAYVYAELTMEALNPYISKTDIVGTVTDNSETLSQGYLADDFTIGDGGIVSFNIPNNFAEKTIKFSFDNLSCKKADDTYGALKSDGYSRYHYVKSDYYDVINENLQNHRSEAASYDYTKKVKVAVAGNQMFKVNNSDKFSVGTSSSTETNVSYEETRYSNSAYASQGGTWGEVSLTKDNPEKECYLITCDETRYNIAPTTTPRHAFYAYYNTTIKLAIQDYEPALTYVKVYDSAMLQTGLDQKAYYGVKVGAKLSSSSEAVEAGTGYLFAQQILNQIAQDANKDNCPSDASHVLYVDASNLNAVLYGDNKDWGKIEDLQNAIGKNAVIYLPIGTTHSLNNIATKTVSGDFKAENNIILADKQPFFAPYDIRVDANNYTQYTRQMANGNGNAKYQTLVLPFTIDINGEGVHTNAYGGSSFKFYNMQLEKALSSEKKDNYDYEVTNHFVATTGTLTESNKPYLVEITNFENSDDEQTLFVVRQNGANIVKTPTMSDGTGDLIEGMTATGNIGTDIYSFTHYGSFNGVQLDGNEADYFYFSKDRFVASYNLQDNKDVYVMPFRGYYTCTGNMSKAKFNMMFISTEPNNEATGINDITEITAAEGGFGFTSGHGTLTITAAKDMTASIRAINGQTVTTLNMQAGDTRQVNVPSGVYLVNGVKVLVK